MRFCAPVSQRKSQLVAETAREGGEPLQDPFGGGSRGSGVGGEDLVMFGFTDLRLGLRLVESEIGSADDGVGGTSV
jgi:hypothetical protein